MDPSHRDSHWSASQFAAAIERGEDPFVLLEQFAASWYAPLLASDGFTDEDLAAAESRLQRPLPRALRRWYSLAGRCAPLVAGNSDRLVAPWGLEVEDARMEFLVENQGVWSLVVREADLSERDPPVYVDDRETLRPLGSNVSTLALRWALYSAKFAAPFTASAEIGGHDVARLLAFAPALPFAPWTLFGPGCASRLHAADDVIIDLDGVDDELTWAWVGARTVEALECTMNCIGAEWEAHIGTKPYSVWRAEQERAR